MTKAAEASRRAGEAHRQDSRNNHSTRLSGPSKISLPAKNNSSRLAALHENSSIHEIAFRDVNQPTEDLGTSVYEGGLVLRRKQLASLSAVMGKAFRSPITGEIRFKDHIGLEDFFFVDLAKRRGGILPGGTALDLEQDPYLFKVVPLLTRTWMYHELVINGSFVGSKHDPNASIKSALDQRCCDAPFSMGLSSPLMCYVSGAIGATLTGNHTLILYMLVLIGLLLCISKLSNSVKHYRRSRLYSILLRLAFFGLVLTRLDFSSILCIAGYLLILLAIFIDLGTGDWMTCWNYGMHCHYEIIAALEGRLFVCRRHGAFGWEDATGPRGTVPTEVSGLACWERRHHLIADIGDIICELRPLTKSDWHNLTERCLITGDRISYLVLNAFDLKGDSEKKMASGKLVHDIVLEDM